MFKESLYMEIHFMTDFKFFVSNNVPFVEGQHKDILFVYVQIHGNKT